MAEIGIVPGILKFLALLGGGGKYTVLWIVDVQGWRPMMKDLFTNRPGGGDFTENFFHWHAKGVPTAQLACPFFTDCEPIKILKKVGCRRVQLLIRLCESTNPKALKEASALQGVDIRYYTDRSFHAKFYILGDRALIGSANLTISGMKTNRELSIVLESSDPRFDELPAYFDELWSAPPAAVLTDDTLKLFEQWHKTATPPAPPQMKGIQQAKPFNVSVESWKIDHARTFLESFRATYLETLIPAYRIVEDVYSERVERHPAFKGHSESYELDRFLFWARGFTTDEALQSHPIRADADLRSNIRHHVAEWFAEERVNIDEDRTLLIAALQKLFTNEDHLLTIDMDSLADILQGCAAFVEMLRFTAGGLENHIAAFKKDNEIEKVRAAFYHLAFGSGDFVQRIYDCVYSPEYKLSHWGRNCTLELFGWINNEDVPPFNGRIIKALRYLGFDVTI